jgi:glycosyltransferase involved in cell wall biosynthesis
MALAKARVKLDIRGSNRWGHGDALMALARELSIADRVTLHPLGPPDEMVRLAAAYDIGLSLETEVSESRRLCLTNKIFTYLLAGVPTLLSDTPAQRALEVDLGPAAALVSLADPAGIAATLDRFALVEGALCSAMAAAWRLGHQRYNWEVEQQTLLRAVDAAFARHAPRASCTR